MCAQVIHNFHEIPGTLSGWKVQKTPDKGIYHI